MKKCFKCNVEKSLSEFYPHKQMGDGHLNKCKDCTKTDTKERIDRLKNDRSWIESERKRGREKYHRLYPYSTQTINHEAKRIGRKQWIDRYPEKEAALRKLGARFKQPGFHRHHWSYNIEHALDIIQLVEKDHYTAHRFIEYDQAFKMYRCKETGELLDTKEKHYQFIMACIAGEKQKAA